MGRTSIPDSTWTGRRPRRCWQSCQIGPRRRCKHGETWRSSGHQMDRIDLRLMYVSRDLPPAQVSEIRLLTICLALFQVLRVLRAMMESASTRRSPDTTRLELSNNMSLLLHAMSLLSRTLCHPIWQHLCKFLRVKPVSIEGV
jgi:hypothetical protein